VERDSTASELQARMAAIRANRIKRIAELQIEAHRLTDWREHVRSAPLVSVIGSAIVGFLAVKSLSSSSTKLTAKVDAGVERATTATTATRPTMVQTLIGLGCNLAMTAGKQYFMQQIQNAVNSNHHATFKNRASHDQERATP
jgi:hypothetical protein